MGIFKIFENNVEYEYLSNLEGGLNLIVFSTVGCVNRGDWFCVLFLKKIYGAILSFLYWMGRLREGDINTIPETSVWYIYIYIGEIGGSLHLLDKLFPRNTLLQRAYLVGL